MNSSIREVVFLFKAVSEEYINEVQIKDPYVFELERKGFDVLQVLVLDFVYKNIDCLKYKLLHPERYSGIIFTSPRCVRAAINAIGNAYNLEKEWKELKTFAVGETTERLVQDNLGLSSKGSCAGNGKALAPLILEYEFEKPLLLPCGNLKMDTLEDLLKKGGVATETVEVYETIPHPDLEANLTSLLKGKTPSYVVYFSPSGIRNTYPILKQSGICLDAIKWVSIGPTTAEALQTFGLQVYCSAAKPTPQSLAEAMTTAV